MLAMTLGINALEIVHTQSCHSSSGYYSYTTHGAIGGTTADEASASGFASYVSSHVFLPFGFSILFIYTSRGEHEGLRRKNIEENVIFLDSAFYVLIFHPFQPFCVGGLWNHELINLVF